MLTYHLLCWITKRLEAHNDTRDWQTIRRLLGTHSLITTQLPLADGRTINIRKPSQPDDEQKRVYQMLGIDWKSAFPTKKTKCQPEENVVPLERPPRFYAGFRSSVRNLG